MNFGFRIADCGLLFRRRALPTLDRKLVLLRDREPHPNALPPARSPSGKCAFRTPRPAIPRAVGAAFASALALAPLLSAAPLTLDDAIRLALQRNQGLKVSAFTPDIARANVLAEYGRFDPALTFRRSYSEGEAPVTTTPLVRSLTQTDDYSLSLGGLTPWGATYGLTATADNQRGTFNRFTDNFVTFGGVSVTQPLLSGFGFGANLAGLRIARADRGIADWKHRETVINTVTGVVLVYASVLQAR